MTAGTATTRERLLDAAERLFGSFGVSATSLRQITAEAGTNVASVNYHFGSKQNLVRQVLGRRLEPMNAERLRRLDLVLAEAGDERPDLRELVRAFLVPAFELGRDAQGRAFFLVIARTHSSADPDLRQVVMEQFREVAQAFVGAFARSLGGADPGEVLVRGHFIVGALCHSVMNMPMLATMMGALAGGDAGGGEGAQHGTPGEGAQHGTSGEGAHGAWDDAPGEGAGGGWDGVPPSALFTDEALVERLVDFATAGMASAAPGAGGGTT